MPRSKYDPTVAQGDTRVRVNRVLISNELGHARSVIADEQSVVLSDEGEVVTRHVRTLTRTYSSEDGAKRFDIRHPITDAPLGASMSYDEFHAAVYSFCRDMQLEADGPQE